MANYKLTLNDLRIAATHAIGGAPDVNLDVDTIVHSALNHLAGMRPWRWRQKALNLDSVISVPTINLPADFNMLLTIQLVSGSARMMPTSLDAIQQLRAAGVGSLGGDVRYALSYAPQSGVTLEPTPILEVFPTPAASTTGPPYFAVGTYLRQIPKMASPTDAPDVPSYMHPALRAWCRAFAVSDEEQQQGADWAMAEALTQPLEVEDGQATGYVGRLRGGFAPPRPASLASATRQIAGP